MKRGSAVPVDRITKAIFLLRGQRVLLDAKLAQLYGVTTKALNQAVKRNAARFPADFVFRLTLDEDELLRSQIVTLKSGRGEHRKYAPYAFTEHGAIMAATVLNSGRAVEMSVYVVRAFVQLRELLASNAELARRLDELEARIEKKLVGHDQAIAAVLSAIRELMKPAPATQRGIGSTADIAGTK
jgi:ATP-dependent Clp protease ATP-binding subunit ClpA